MVVKGEVVVVGVVVVMVGVVVTVAVVACIGLSPCVRVIMSGPLVWILTVRDAAGQRLSVGVQEVVGIFAAGDLDRNFLPCGAFEDFRASHARGLCERVDLVGEGVGVG